MEDRTRNGSPSEADAAHRTVVLAGATGLVGREILKGLLADPSIKVVHVLGRRAPDIKHPKLTSLVVDFTALPSLPSLDEAYLALGTTIKVAGSQAAFRAVDFDVNLAVAHGAMAAGAGRIGVVSAMGADANSSVFYNRVKGELEDALAALPLDALVIARPSFLVGDRASLGQSERVGETVATRVGAWLRPFIPANYRPIQAADVAAALLKRMPVASGREILLSGDMQRSR